MITLTSILRWLAGALIGVSIAATVNIWVAGKAVVNTKATIAREADKLRVDLENLQHHLENLE